MTHVKPVRTHGAIIRFVLCFGVLFSGYYLLVLLPWCDRALYECLRLNAELSGALLRLCGEPVEVQGTTLRAASYAISIRRGCDAVEPAWLFTAAVLAFPVPWRSKRSVIAVGVTLLLLLNLVRISSLFVIGRSVPGFFATAHLEIWPAVIVLSAIGLWLCWSRRVLGLGRGEKHVAS